MFAIAINALYSTLHRRGTTRQLAGASVICVISALLLLAALVWYNQRLSVEEAAIGSVEVGMVLVSIALWGWLLPLSTTIAYFLFTLPRISHDSMRLASALQASDPPGRRQSYHAPTNPAPAPTTPAPLVFGEDTAWGWLAYANGRLRGQQLELEQAVVKLGRGEDDDIWLDDDRVSPYHAELRWSRGSVPLANRNGPVRVNGQPIYAPVVLRQGDMFEIGVQCFVFAYAQHAHTLLEAGDALEHHRQRAAITPSPVSHNPVALSKPAQDDGDSYHTHDAYATVPSHSTVLPTPPVPLPPHSPLISGPVPLRLPSKPKKV